MIDYFSISNEGVQKNIREGNWLSVCNPTDREKEQLHEAYELPKNFFSLGEKYSNVSFFKKYQTEDEKPHCLMLFINIDSIDEPESRSSAVTVFLTQDVLITMSESSLIEEVLNNYKSEIFTKAGLILHTLQIINEHYLIFLKKQRETIEEISQGTSNGSNKNILEKTTHTEKNLVYIDNLLKEQRKTITHLLDSSLVASDRDLAIEIELQTKQATTSVQIYREMLSSISGLIDSMMDNRLNQLMKFLNTASLLLALPTLIFSLWGINTGGLLWRDSEIGSIMVVLLALLVSIVSGIYLFKKDYDA
ncbi:magnesium transporter CorA family protein [Enterococcus hulanensis]|uniref:Magnesium transporter CorA family protein n=1 Tax=Enterococcus hulanensis TaxID=2559929 RepID=A0ABU3F4H3_9ENTE|nr:magnesium transporter CorA family protein [Enterococcus hulanensis]MDT2602037.1 magnesium transporter CorA family protein [Enterococcus hulanensis]MDT2611308.1 magnesium transporter CorA family protein [Enterococcus hulanensis]MDT2615848.1 magnesium transporter CorA family protein [Enterococcus hulanensis]MDT2630109.1 magnesium transporter CorA family protein [Enterococcus hulanensis]MDT2657590.1 magnesium transporter CorA family protein [Enterococcus hulanensis]